MQYGILYWAGMGGKEQESLEARPMKQDFRDAVFSVVHDLMRADPHIVILSNDNHAWGLDAIRKEFPERAINMGVAEQNMMRARLAASHRLR